MPEPGQIPPASPSEPEATVEPIEIQQEPFHLVDGDDPEDSETAPLTPARRRTRTIVLASLLAVGVAGVGALGWFYWQIHSQRDVTLSLPATIGELTLDSSADAETTADYLQTALSAEVDLDSTAGGVYSGAADKDVLFFGGTTLIWSPDKDLTTSFDLFADDQGSVTGLHDVDAGPLGGSMKCGTTTSSAQNSTPTSTTTGDGTEVAPPVDQEMAVCGWADHGSLALAMFPGRSESEAAPLMRQIRDSIQTRN